MAHTATGKPKIPREREVTETMSTPTLIDVPKEVGKRLDAWLADSITERQNSRKEQLARADDWKKTLSGIRPKPPIRESMSNLSVPLTMWARTAIRARLLRGILDARPIFSADPYRGRSVESESLITAGKAIARVLESDFRNQRGLGGMTAMYKIVTEVVDLGTGVLKVIPKRDVLKKVFAPFEGDQSAGPKIISQPGRICWDFISIHDCLWFDGFGTDTQEMPFIGHEFPTTWAKVINLAASNHYDRSVVTEVEAFYKTRSGMGDSAAANELPFDIRPHQIAELYLDYDIDDDGHMESIMIHWHVDARRRLMTTWSPFPDGHRPILGTWFDIPADPTRFLGQGIPEKLQGVQEEVDEIHNIGIEGGKRGIAHVIALRAGTGAEEDLGGGQDILTGEVTVTENPDTDIKPHPLGDPRGSQFAIALEERARRYVTQLLGLDPGTMGEVESGKRVPASLGLSIQREGRVIVANAMDNLSKMLEEAGYLTLDLYKRFIPANAMAAALDEEEALLLKSLVFSLSTDAIRSQFVLTVNAQDAASAQETRKQELLIINQFLLGFYERITNLVMALSNPQVPIPPEGRKALLLIMERMERGVEALLNQLESVPNPTELLIKVGEVTRLLENVAAPLTQPGPTAGPVPEEAPAPPPEASALTGADESLGANVV